MPRNAKDDPALLWDMLDAALAVQEFVRGNSFDDYMASSLLQAAVERKIEIIGEAARHVSKETIEMHPEIEWRGIRAQRHVLAHEYGDIKQDRVWRVATVYVPDLISKLQVILPNPPRI